MPLTYTEIEQQKNSRIWIFFSVVLLFYFLIAIILGNVTKLFFLSQLRGAAGKVQPFLTGKEILYIILFAFVAAVLHTLYSMGTALSFIQKNLNTQGIDASDRYHKQFRNIVDEVNVATGSKYKITPVVIPTVAMNAFAISDFNRNAILGVTEGLLSKLTRQQLQGVVAHEVAHIASGDSFQATIGCSLFGIYAAMLNSIRKMLGGGGRTRTYGYGRGGGGIIIFLIFIFIILSIMQFFYRLIRLFMSRDRESRADAIAVRLTRDPISLSEALYAISRGWRGLGYIDQNLSALFIINPLRSAIDEKEGFWANLMSTHPPMAKRMAVLAHMAHSDVKNIQEHVLSQEKMKERIREKRDEKKMQRWMVLGEDKSWQGPFDIPQIMLMGWVRPDTWIKALGDEQVRQAKEEPLFKPIFDGQVKGLKTASHGCPRCTQPLVQEEYEGAVIERCIFCDGALVYQDRVPRIIIRKEEGFSDRIKKLSELTQKNGLEKMRSKLTKKEESLLHCPQCSARMVRNFYTMAYLVEVDRCTVCSLVWFDKDELDIVQCMIENKQAV